MSDTEKTLVDKRDPVCVKLWPECYSFGYDPRCCRFPKNCSAGGWELGAIPEMVEVRKDEPGQIYHAVVNKKHWTIQDGVWTLDPEEETDGTAS